MHVKGVSSDEEKFIRLHIQISSGYPQMYSFYITVLLFNAIQVFFKFVGLFLQIVILASITMTVFFRTRMKVDYVGANKYLGALFYSLMMLVVNGFPELSMTVARLSVFYKQRELCFYPAWAYAIPASIIKIPISFLEAVIWVSLTYYVIGYSPEPQRLVLLDNTYVVNSISTR